MGVDVGLEQQQRNSVRLNNWHASVILLRYEVRKHWNITTRLEHYYDASGVIVPLVNGESLQLKGFSINLDHKLGSNLLLRAECRWLENRNLYFMQGARPETSNAAITAVMAVAF
mgnify:CR=1 FL=1